MSASLPSRRQPPLTAQSVFKKHFGYPPVYLAQSPMRVLLMGNEADFTEGLALTVTLNGHLQVAVAPRTDGKIGLASHRYPQRTELWMSTLRRNSQVAWADPVKAVLHRLRQHGVHFSGFNASVFSTAPESLGLGNASALTVATALAVREMFPYRITPSGTLSAPQRDRGGRLPPLTSIEKTQIARICDSALRDFLKHPAGILNPLSALFGKPFCGVQVDLQHQTVEQIPLIGDIAMVLCDTGLPPRPSARAIKPEDFRQHCRLAAIHLKARSLRSVEMRWLKDRKQRLTEDQYRCAYHVLGENARVVAAERSLNDGDIRQVGQFMLQSHESLRENLGAVPPEVDLLVTLARAHPACLGARMAGQRATINLVEFPRLEEFMTSMKTLYQRLTRQEISPRLCHFAEGAAAIHANESFYSRRAKHH